MQILTAPNYIYLPKNTRKLFLAGGISGCGDWQQDVIKSLDDENIFILNPRRKGSINRKDLIISREQVAWEHFYLREATEIMFWFPDSSICPIALFELGGALERDQFIYVGCDPNYDRIVDLKIQIELSKKPIKLVHSLKEIINQIRA